MPTLIKIPIGGVKVVYRYTEELAKLGHKVSILSPRKEGDHFYHLLKAGVIKMRDCWHKVENKPYYDTPPGVEHHIIPSPSLEHIPDGDAIIATGWQTAYWVDVLPEVKGKKFYFIQNYETYLGNEKTIKQTWSLPMKKIVIAQWLKELAENMGETAHGPIQNAIDPEEFYITNPIEDRLPKISMLYHRLPIKGARDGISALERVKESNLNLKATIFASRTPRITIPNWISLEIRPDGERLREIYNSTAVFLHTSHQEGWPLPPAESMMCGCAVVAAANEGIQEYITHNKSGLLSPIGDVNTMVENIRYLLDNPGERVRISRTGQDRINKFSWEKSAKQFEEILVKAI
ncbi:MAG: glycosyltransferase family 4 protein [Candidatus Cloacimonetes bacterium]|nr:glycosyltransferase family 4 protein [Candidatus Cloacimonadota bacterium]